MKRLKKVLLYLQRMRSLKYIVVIAFAVIVVGFVDTNSVWGHFRNKRKIADLESEISRYREQHEIANRQLRQLDRNPKAIEKIARERYFMKKDDEDIFVLSDDKQQSQQSADTDDETTE